MSLNDLVTVNISASAVTPSKPGFGTVLVAVQKVPVAWGTDRVRQYGSLTEMVSGGFLVTDPAYLCAQKMFAQEPAPERVLIGRRANKVTQTIELKCLSAVEGEVYSIKIGATQITYTVLAAATTTTVATAIELLVEAVTGIASSSATDTITAVTSAAGDLIDYTDWSANFAFKDVTADGGSGGLAADLTAIAAATTLDWYGLALDSNSEAEINLAATFTESAKKIFVPNTSDSAAADNAVTSDVMSDIETGAFARTGVLFSKRQLLSYSGAAWMAERFAGAKPGEDTWKFKTLATVTADTLLDAERTAILNKHGNFYAPTSGVNITEEGWSGAGEYLDVVRFVDWLKAEIQFRVFFALVNNPKLPYTQAGADAIGAIIKGALLEGEEIGGIAEGTSTVTVPVVANISSATKATRRLAGIKFKGTLAGAIHSLDIAGTLTP